MDKAHMPDQITTLTRFVDWANWGYLTAIVLGLFCSGLIYYYSNKLNKAKDLQSDQERRTSNEKIAALTAETENAKKERALADLRIEEARKAAAQANEATAKINQETKRLENANLKLHGDIAKTTKELTVEREKVANLMYDRG